MEKIETFLASLSAEEHRDLRDRVQHLLPFPPRQAQSLSGNRFVNHPVWNELIAYVGLWNFRWEWMRAEDRLVHEDFLTYPDAASFYRDTEVYLYHLIGFWLEGIKLPYLGALLSAYEGHQFSLLDYGCGIGSDGLWLLEAGVTVSFADIASKSLDFLRYRLARRGYHDCNVFTVPDDIEAIEVHDVAWCMDVLEHLPPEGHRPLLDQLITKGETVFCSLVADPLADGLVHHPVDVDGLTAYVSSRWPMRYTDFYIKADGGKVRLLMYGPHVEGGYLAL